MADEPEQQQQATGCGKTALVVVGLFVASILLIVAFGGGGDGPTRAPTVAPNESVLADIRAETDCGELQAAFDRAMDQVEARSTSDPLRAVSMEYAEAADRRMEIVGCYGP